MIKKWINSLTRLLTGGEDSTPIQETTPEIVPSMRQLFRLPREIRGGALLFQGSKSQAFLLRTGRERQWKLRRIKEFWQGAGPDHVEVTP